MDEIDRIGAELRSEIVRARREDAAGEEPLSADIERVNAFIDKRCTGGTPECPCPHGSWDRITAALSTAERERSVPAVPSAEQLAAKFHDTYELLAPRHGYETRKASAKPWSEVPEPNKSLMIAVADEVLIWLSLRVPSGGET